jgi:hypothetical protein
MVIILWSSRMWRHTVWKIAVILHGVTPQKAPLFTSSKVRISNLTGGNFATTHPGILSTCRQNRRDLSVCCVSGGTVGWGTAVEPESRGFDSRWNHWNFSFASSLRPHYGTGVDSASNRNEYQEYFLGSKGRQHIHLLISWNQGALISWNPQGTTIYWTSFYLIR